MPTAAEQKAKSKKKRTVAKGSERARKQLVKAKKTAKTKATDAAKANAVAAPKATVNWKEGRYYIGKSTRTKVVPSEPSHEVFKVLKIRGDGITIEPTVIGGTLNLPLFYKAREMKGNADKAIVAKAKKANQEYIVMKTENEAKARKPKGPTSGYTAFVRQQFIDGPVTNDQVLKATLKKFPECSEDQVRKVLGPQKWHAQQAGYKILKAKAGKEWYYVAAAEGEIKENQKKLKAIVEKADKK